MKDKIGFQFPETRRVHHIAIEDELGVTEEFPVREGNATEQRSRADGGEVFPNGILTRFKKAHYITAFPIIILRTGEDMGISIDKGHPVRVLKNEIDAAGVETFKIRGLVGDFFASIDKFGAHLPFCGKDEILFITEMKEDRAFGGVGFLRDKTGGENAGFIMSADFNRHIEDALFEFLVHTPAPSFCNESRP
jgi:hypothetical protein